MRWFRSELVRRGRSTIAYLFLCPKCEHREITKTGFAAECVPPSVAVPPSQRQSDVVSAQSRP